MSDDRTVKRISEEEMQLLDLRLFVDSSERFLLASDFIFLHIEPPKIELDCS